MRSFREYLNEGMDIDKASELTAERDTYQSIKELAEFGEVDAFVQQVKKNRIKGLDQLLKKFVSANDILKKQTKKAYNPDVRKKMMRAKTWSDELETAYGTVTRTGKEIAKELEKRISGIDKRLG